MPAPTKPKIYHIVHVDRLPSIVSDGFLWCDAEIERRAPPGTTIGIDDIKQRRLSNTLRSHSGLHVGDCVPFYFCPRSVMLYVIYRRDHPELEYDGGQEPIVHLEADLEETVAWADRNKQRWAFTLSNAGSRYFEDHCDLAQLDKIDWKAVRAEDWRDCKEGKQAEFLIEQQFPWELVARIGVRSQRIYQQAMGCRKKECVNHVSKSCVSGIIDRIGEARMIRFKTGDILAEDAEALVNTVNCVGVMGRGIALSSRRRFQKFPGLLEAARATRFGPAGCSCTRPISSSTRDTSSISRPSGTGAATAGWKMSRRGCRLSST